MPRTHLRWDPGPSPLIPGQPPAAPGWVTSIAFDGGAAVSWDTSGGGGPVASAVITPYIAGSPQAATTVTAPAGRGIVTGLTNSTAYTFRVQLANQAGTAMSPMSAANTPLANLIFGDDFNGTALDPSWTVVYRDGDQSQPENCYYLPQQVSLDGNSHLTMLNSPGPVSALTYNDANPPFYRGGALVTRGTLSGHIQWTYPGQITTNQGMAISGFTQAGFNFLYGKIQVNMQQANCGAGGIPGSALFGCNLQGVNAYDPNNVGTANWPHAGSEETDIANPTMGNFAGYNANIFYFTTSNQNGPAANVPVTNMTTTFHTYEVDWSASGTSWWLDGVQQVANFTTYIPAAAMFLDMTNAIGSGTASYIQPGQILDWVRVFHN